MGKITGTDNNVYVDDMQAEIKKVHESEQFMQIILESTPFGISFWNKKNKNFRLQ